MEKKFTPGTWVVKKGTEKKKWERRFYVYAETTCNSCSHNESRHICVSLESAVGYDQADANAKLIAAAPDLLEALQDCLEWMKKVNTSDEGDQAFQLAQNAIKKATE
jgi:hypothetical protein